MSSFISSGVSRRRLRLPTAGDGASANATTARMAADFIGAAFLNFARRLGSAKRNKREMRRGRRQSSGTLE
eukprot:CAMPEP_0170246482 /NCGR_PEP_ID=MMETSP0116_2-20130129/23028_1 /TAXON_ID=400756 /ORGANISM="Durinskia baltica, Strain CSIRO CS-38" /LENGTH=70 /DNA_ID=CAMNT_0010497359 /DNA_START=24 /DNA_END=233 /DNA_ORIENTATION=-